MKYVSSESKSQSRIGDVKTVGADRYVSVVNVNGDKANIFGDYLSGVFTWESDEEFNELPPPRCSVFPCDEVSFNEIIFDKLKNLKVNKSPGPDMLHPRILYEVRHQIVTLCV